MRLVAQDSRESRDERREPGLVCPHPAPRSPVHGRRGGFTLIEMLLVLVIILTLTGLLLAAVFRASLFGKSVSTANDVQQLAVAIQNFKTQFGFYPPSKIRLCKRQVDYSFWQDSTTHVMYPLETDSVYYISKLASRITDTTPSGGALGQTKSPWMCPASDTNTVPNQDFIDWDGTGTYTAMAGATPPGSVVLEGDQCLVFFLGGMPSTITPTGYVTGILTCTGFSKNPFNPALPRQSQTEDRLKFYDFDSGRLVSLPTSTTNRITRSATPPLGPYSPVFPSYIDQDGQLPFLYFSSYRSTNGYNRYFVGVPPTVSGPTYTSGPWSDCQSFESPTGVWPYLQPNSDYANSETYQLLSAGGDKKFGPGTTKNSATAAISIGTQTVTLAIAPVFAVGQRVLVDVEAQPETVAVTAVHTTTPYSFQATFTKAHNANCSVNWQVWSKATAGDVYLPGAPGADDVANFSEKPLGTTVANQ